MMASATETLPPRPTSPAQTSRLWGAGRSLAPWLGCAMLFSLALNGIWWGLLSPEARPESIVSFEIPAGTAEAIASGNGTAFVPSRIALPPDGRLRILNRDTAEHTIAGVTIPPGALADIAAPDGSGFTCTIHPSGYLNVDLVKRPPITAMALPTLLLGLPLGVIGGAAIVVTKRIGVG